MPRSKIYGGDEAYRGYQASKKRYFYGIKIHLMVTETGEPVEFFLSTGLFADVRGLRVFSFDLPVGSVVYADKADNDYETEDLLLEAEHIQLSAMGKHNSKYLLILLRYLTFSGNLSCN
ncbi:MULTISPECIES: transposase [Microcystis]|uniref:Uncharacterized protein n=1 Tax=Microcystis aeruginosa TAIHU98 TaxID=1134457 RepID=L7EEP0_MICAE|nr:MULTISPECIES: transposase [Microcystis]MDY7048087.1 transposase [Microcystis panniformis WG22]ELP56757.1 hypothetical protein O53_1366 [Microcystis aeruginosa TAIHU98]MCA2622300.1 transposase [Microcystis sp. M19BS1]MCA2632891.1 transposase [Microcystis sp. M20BS1]MDB9385524.1 transposase [Microcystis aeruginosa CS-583]